MAAPPPVGTKLRNLADTMIEEAKAILSKRPQTTPEEKKRRLSICANCEHFDKDRKICKICGCYMQIKAGFRSVGCPIGKW